MITTEWVLITGKRHSCTKPANVTAAKKSQAFSLVHELSYGSDGTVMISDTQISEISKDLGSNIQTIRHQSIGIFYLDPSVHVVKVTSNKETLTCFDKAFAVSKITGRATIMFFVGTKMKKREASYSRKR